MLVPAGITHQRNLKLRIGLNLRVVGLSRTARIERPLLYRGGSASTRDSLPLYPLPSFCLPQPGPCDLTGGANLGARPPAAGSLHRAGCEDGRAGQRQDPSAHTGQVSSFHAISQNIHSYRELMTNDSSIRRFSSLPAVLAHWSTFLRIQRCTSANSGDA